MFRVYNSDKHSRVERVVYRAIGADPSSQQGWGAYARSVLTFSAVSILAHRRVASAPSRLGA
ncbi:MAG: potassium-transporting ATPase potassium-binding subunit [Mycobacterium sp.]|jgi:K+-transporting ATPase ATPase A chain|nr:potassium-transporting ATPase potassium-binding subunit [Mycobacterium sp.]